MLHGGNTRPHFKGTSLLYPISPIKGGHFFVSPILSVNSIAYFSCQVLRGHRANHDSAEAPAWIILKIARSVPKSTRLAKHDDAETGPTPTRPEQRNALGKRCEQTLRNAVQSKIPPTRKGSSMACYPCTHCNKCGIYSARAAILCAECSTPIPVGTARCPNCGSKKFKAESLSPVPPTPRGN